MFYYGSVESSGPASLFDAYDLIEDIVGKGMSCLRQQAIKHITHPFSPGAATLFAIALLFSGQSATIIATVAGQVVSEGYIRWTMPPFLRRLLTRLLGLVPSLAVAVAVGRPGIDSLLVVSQVALSVCLPFVTLPLLLLTSSDKVMSVRRPREEERRPPLAEVLAVGKAGSVEDEKTHVKEEQSPTVPPVGDVEGAAVDADEIISYANSRTVVILGWILWLLVVVANVYVLVTLGLGHGGSH